MACPPGTCHDKMDEFDRILDLDVLDVPVFCATYHPAAKIFSEGVLGIVFVLAASPLLLGAPCRSGCC